jgi:HEPN domain-containing protein
MKGKPLTEVPGMKFSFDQARHILPELRKIVSGKWQPTLLDQERLLDHLTACAHCQTSVEMFVAATLDTPLEHPSNESVQKLLIRLQDALHKLQEQEEQIAAYAETLEVHGVKEANKRFPAFSEHLKHCEVCKAEVEDMRNVLRQVAHAGLIKPLREDVKA